MRPSKDWGKARDECALCHRIRSSKHFDSLVVEISAYRRVYGSSIGARLRLSQHRFLARPGAAPLSPPPVSQICVRCAKSFVYTSGGLLRRGSLVCRACIVRERACRVKQELVRYAGGKCIRCGYARCVDALAFHHRNAGQKEFGIAQGSMRSMSKLRREVDKCDLLCLNCHSEVHRNAYADTGQRNPTGAPGSEVLMLSVQTLR